MTRFSRTTVLGLWLVFVPLVFAVVPVALAWLLPRAGWRDGSPAGWNLLGVIPLAAGLALAIWALAAQYRVAEHGWSATLKPKAEYLLTDGPYAITRNPMYLGGATAWLGWSIRLGSVSVLIGGLLFWGYLAVFVVRNEERALEITFGQRYTQYRARVPRWVGWRQ